MVETIRQWWETAAIRQWWETATQVELIWQQIAVAALVFLLFLVARGLFTRFVFAIILRLTTKTKTNMDTNILLAFEKPLKGMFLIAGAYIALTYLPLSLSAYNVISLMFRSLVVAFVAWGLYNFSGRRNFQELIDNYKVDLILVDFFTKIIRFVIIAMAVLMIFDVWDFEVSGFITGLGLGGLAFALAAKDAVSNIFGGIVIIMDKPFTVGDWIHTANVEGTVEEMTFRSTKIRTFAHALITVPNSVLANEPITNWTRMGKRRITFNLGVTYTTSRHKLKKCVERIRTMLEDHPDIHNETIFVQFEKFSDSSLDIFIYCFTNTTRWGEYLAVKEDVNFKIMEILEQENVSVAFPSRSLYFETPLQSEVGESDLPVEKPEV